VLGDGTKVPVLGGELSEGEGTTLRRSRAEYPQFHYFSSTKLASGLRQPCVDRCICYTFLYREEVVGFFTHGKGYMALEMDMHLRAARG
jgi:hypothetical protein